MRYRLQLYLTVNRNLDKYVITQNTTSYILSLSIKIHLNSTLTTSKRV